jgi:protein SCO1/2
LGVVQHFFIMPPSSPPRPSLYRWPIRIGVVLIVVVLFVRIFGPARFLHEQANRSPELRKMSIVPPFALTERSGKTITNHDLAGKIWVADFIYTTCPGPCPLITAGMAKLQDAVAHDPQVQLVSFTVDPQTDTPAVLAKYADQFGADPNRWWFLTGPEKPLDDLIQKGFLQAVQDNRGQPLQEDQSPVTHSTYLALVDADGTVRGFYDGVGTSGRADLLRDIKILEKEEP